jgi:hypothetical protein
VKGRNAVRVHVVVPSGFDHPDQPTGGNIYDRRVCAGLAQAGWDVLVTTVGAAAGPAAASGHGGAAQAGNAGGAEVAAGNTGLPKGPPGTQAQVARARQQAANVPVGDAAAWQFVGPANVGGRVAGLAVDPTATPTTVYAAITAAGIMKSTDGGVTWTPAWPASNVQAMGALARGSDGTLWAGTGEANPSGGGDEFLTDAAPMGDGLYKSTDGGKSWQLSGLPNSGAFGRIAVNPDNTPVWMITYDQSRNQLYAATDFGAFYLENGQTSWTRLGTGLPNAAVTDLKFSGDGNTIYAATYGRGIYQIPTPQG